MNNRFKQATARNFSNKARDYNELALLQQHTAKQLCKLASPYLSEKDIIFDVGAGTGFIAKTLKYKTAFAIDLAFNMCKHTHKLGISTINGDVEMLPFKTASCNAILTSLTLQWVNNLETALKECNNILSSNGIIAFSIVADGAFHELHTSLTKTGHANRIFNFKPSPEITQLMEKAGFEVLKEHQEQEIKYITHCTELIRELKAIGANASKNTFYPGKEFFVKLNNCYTENFGTEKGLPVSWKINYLIARKGKR